MLKKVVLAAGVGALLASTAVFAEEQDMAEFTCGQFISDVQADPSAATQVLWFAGFVNGEQGSLNIDTDLIAQFATQVTQICAQQQDAKVIDVAKTVAGQ